MASVPKVPVIRSMSPKCEEYQSMIAQAAKVAATIKDKVEFRRMFAVEIAKSGIRQSAKLLTEMDHLPGDKVHKKNSRQNIREQAARGSFRHTTWWVGVYPNGHTIRLDGFQTSSVITEELSNEDIADLRPELTVFALPHRDAAYRLWATVDSPEAKRSTSMQVDVVSAHHGYRELGVKQPLMSSVLRSVKLARTLFHSRQTRQSSQIERETYIEDEQVRAFSLWFAENKKKRKVDGQGWVQRHMQLMAVLYVAWRQDPDVARLWLHIITKAPVDDPRIDRNVLHELISATQTMANSKTYSPSTHAKVLACTGEVDCPTNAKPGTLVQPDVVYWTLLTCWKRFYEHITGIRKVGTAKVRFVLAPDELVAYVPDIDENQARHLTAVATKRAAERKKDLEALKAAKGKSPSRRIAASLQDRDD